MSLNSVSLLGRLTTTPELKTTPQGVAVSTFGLAVSRSYVKSGEERQADFIDIVAWRSTAEFICKHMKKGQMIAINGTLQTRLYTDKNGNNRKSVEVVAHNVFFAGEKAKDEELDINTDDDFTPVADNEDLPF